MAGTRTTIEMVWNNSVAEAYTATTLIQFNDAVANLSREVAGQPRELVQQRVSALLRDWEGNLEVAAQLHRRYTTPRVTIGPA